jgi:NAD(P)-dependent dehydrogenase (short-subunit alcohol dehydrogenase family)
MHFKLKPLDKQVVFIIGASSGIGRQSAVRGFHRAQGDVDRDRHVAKISLYGVARRHPVTTVLAAAAGTAALGLLVGSKNGRGR